MTPLGLLCGSSVLFGGSVDEGGSGGDYNPATTSLPLHPGEGGNQSLTHPNEKPVALLEQLIEATTIPGALILDPFAGSGSTLAAAAKTGRQYIGIEIDEQYSKLAATRAAEHHQKGETT